MKNYEKGFFFGIFGLMKKIVDFIHFLVGKNLKKIP